MGKTSTVAYTAMRSSNPCGWIYISCKGPYNRIRTSDCGDFDSLRLFSTSGKSPTTQRAL